MTHEDRGHYAKKHPTAKQDPELADRIKSVATEGNLDCASAHRIVKSTGCKPLDIGIQADLLELRISRCQMGLFGHGPDKKKNLNPDINVSKELESDILNSQRQGRLTCSQCWEMAKAHKIAKIEMGSVCEKLEIKIKPCQLGAF